MPASRKHRIGTTLAVVGILIGGNAGSTSAQSWEVPASDSVRARFGSALALSSRLLVVGSPGSDDHGPDSGAITVFDFEQRRLLKRLPGAGTSTNGSFGRAVAIAAGSVLVGAPAHTRAVAFSGSVRIVSDDGPDDGPDRILLPPDPQIGTGFGAAIAADRRTLLIGAPGGVAGGDRRGVVHVYRLLGEEFVPDGILRPPRGTRGDSFGAAIALQGDYAVIGAPGFDGTGTAFLFARTLEDAWKPVAQLDASEARPGDAIGASVALSAGLVLVGAPNSDGVSDGSGAVYAFDVATATGSEPILQARVRLEPTEPVDQGRYGASLAASGSLVAIGAPGERPQGRVTGAVHLLDDPVARRTSSRVLSVPTFVGGEAFGAALALDGDRLVVGAPGAHGDVGTAFLYEVSGSAADPAIQADLVLHQAEGLSSAAVNGIVRDDAGHLLIGAFRRGLDLFDGIGVTTLAADAADSTSISDDGVLAVTRDLNGVYWIGTEDGLNRFDRATRSFHRYALTPEEDREPVVAVLVTRSGVVWTGTNGRLFRYDRGLDRFDEWEAFRVPPAQLDEAYISGLAEDSRGRVWVLAKNLFENRASLYRVDPSTEGIVRYPLDSEWGQVGPLLIDHNDNLWIKAPRPVSLPEGEQTVVSPPGPPVDVSHWSFVEDAAGSVWLGTATGLYRWRPGDHNAALTRIIPSAESGRPWDYFRTLYELGPGELLAGTPAGIYRVTDPETARSRGPGITLALTSIDVTGRDGPRTIDPYGMQQLSLTHDDYYVGFAFSSVALRPRVGTRLRYRLRGVDRTWVDAGNRRYAGYSNVSAGEFVFDVQAVESTSDQPLASTSLRLYVAPAYWQTLWFRSLVALAVMGFGGAAYAYRRHAVNELRQMRVRIARDLHDDLSTNLSGIALASERAAMGDQGRAAELTVIAGTARSMLQDLRDLVWIMDPAQDTGASLCVKMHEIARALLGDRATLDIGLEGLDAIDMSARRELLLIYKELLNNIARHAEATSIAVRLRRERDSVVLEVADDGVGFDPDATRRGHGLDNVHARATALSGSLETRSAPGSGTRSRLVLPC